MTDNHMDDPWALVPADDPWVLASEKRELILDEDPNVHLKNAELALCERRYDDAETHASYAENVAREKSKNQQKQVKKQCDIVRGFVYLGRAEAAIGAEQFAEAGKLVDLAGPLCQAENRLREKFQYVAGQVNAHWIEKAQLAFQRGAYDTVGAYIERILKNARYAGLRDQGPEFNSLVGDLASVYFNQAADKLSAGKIEDARTNINRARALAENCGGKTAKSFDAALAGLVGSYLNGARDALSNGRYHDVIAQIGYARSLSIGCGEAIQKCDDMTFAMADACLSKARDAVAERRFDEVEEYLVCVRSAANGQPKILGDCTAVRAGVFLEKARIALEEKKYEAVPAQIQQAQDLWGSSGTVAKEIKEKCNTLWGELTEAYLKEARTALRKNQSREAEEYAEQARLLAKKPGIQEAHKGSLIAVHIDLAEAALRKKEYAAVDAPAEYVQSILQQKGGEYYRCGILRSKAFLKLAKEAFDKSDYGQAASLLEKAKSASLGDAAMGKQCMKLLRRLKRKGYGKDVSWDVDRLRKEAFLRAVTKAAKRAAAIAAIAGLVFVVGKYAYHRFYHGEEPLEDGKDYNVEDYSFEEQAADQDTGWDSGFEEEPTYFTQNEPDDWSLDQNVLCDILLKPYGAEEIDSRFPVECALKITDTPRYDCGGTKVIGDRLAFHAYLGDCQGNLWYQENATLHGFEVLQYRSFSWQPFGSETYRPADLMDELDVQFVRNFNDHMSLYDWNDKLFVVAVVDYQGEYCFHPFLLQFVLKEDVEDLLATGYLALSPEDQKAYVSEITSIPEDSLSAVDMTENPGMWSVFEETKVSAFRESGGPMTTNWVFVLYEDGRIDIYVEDGSLIPFYTTEGFVTADSIAWFSDIPELEDRTFYLFNKAYTWSTYIKFHQDGLFEGGYFDRRPDEIGANYPGGTVYANLFHGYFRNLKKIDDYTYEMRVRDLVSYTTPSEREVVGDTLYVNVDLDTLSNGDRFYLYCPGRTTADLPEGFLNWAKAVWEPQSAPSVLSFWGLYNVDWKEGFVG